MNVALLTGGFDKPYAFGLSMALAARRVSLEVVGSDEVESPEMHSTPGVSFLNLHGSWSAQASTLRKLLRVTRFYVHLIKYAIATEAPIFHILWNNKAALFDRTLLSLIYKALGKRLVLTAHNVNAGQRDGRDSLLNRLTLRSQYRLVDHIFVHTSKMRQELVRDFGVTPEAVTVIPFGINNAVPHTELTATEARLRLGIPARDKVILFFGNIRAYKGLEHLVEALALLVKGDSTYRLIIAGSAPNEEGRRCWADIQRSIQQHGLASRIHHRVEYIPDNETEVYFKAANVAALPYVYIYQSGVLSLSYSFGLPVIASNVGSFEEEVVEGQTGFLCKASDAADLARAIREYFDSDLYRELEARRDGIREYAAEQYSWEKVSGLTCAVYAQLLAGAQR